MTSCNYCHKYINRINDSFIVFTQTDKSIFAHYSCAEPYIEEHHENYLWWKENSK